MGRHGDREGRPIDQTTTTEMPVVVDEPVARRRSPLERLGMPRWFVVVPPIAVVAFVASYMGFAPGAPADRGAAVVSPSTAPADDPVVSPLAPSPTRRVDRSRPRRVAPVKPSRTATRRSKAKRTPKPSPPTRRTEPPAKPTPTPVPMTNPPTTPEPNGGTSE